MAESEVSFINGYVRAWNVATTNGFSSLTSIGSGNGLRAFNDAVDDLSLDQACDFGFFSDTKGQTWLEKIKNYFWAKRYCWTERGPYEYDYDM
jgi:hypothetical protein